MEAKSGGDVEPTRKPTAIARVLGRQIVSGELKPGDKLEGEVPASLNLNVSRAAYREGVSLLVAKGLVESHAKVGNIVSEQRYWNLLDTDVLGWVFESEAETRILSNLVELRRMFEPEAALLAAQRRSDQDLNAIESALLSMERHTLTSPEGLLADEQFHVAILQASGNIFMRSLSGSISAAVQWANILGERAHVAPLEAIDDHRRIYEAIKSRDGVSARQFMTAIIDFSMTDMSRITQRAVNRLAKGEVVVMRSDTRPARR